MSNEHIIIIYSTHSENPPPPTISIDTQTSQGWPSFDPLTFLSINVKLLPPPPPPLPPPPNDTLTSTHLHRRAQDIQPASTRIAEIIEIRLDMDPYMSKSTSTVATTCQSSSPWHCWFYLTTSALLTVSLRVCVCVCARARACVRACGVVTPWCVCVCARVSVCVCRECLRACVRVRAMHDRTLPTMHFLKYTSHNECIAQCHSFSSSFSSATETTICNHNKTVSLFMTAAISLLPSITLIASPTLRSRSC